MDRSVKDIFVWPINSCYGSGRVRMRHVCRLVNCLHRSLSSCSNSNSETKWCGYVNLADNYDGLGVIKNNE